MKKEKNYEFRKRMLQIHEKNIRDVNLLPKEGEFILRDGLKIFVSAQAGDVILTAAKDFVDFLFTSMGISAMLKCGKADGGDNEMTLSLAAETGVALEEASGYRGYRIDVDNGININGFDERGVAQALYYLEDVMTMRKAPFIEKGVVKRKPMYGPQMVHSGYGYDRYPNEFLAAIAHEGRDAIMITVKGVNMTDRGYLDFNELIYWAGKYGLDVYAYSEFKSEKHPDEEGAEAYYEGTYGRLFTECPGLKGVILVGESVLFPSHDQHVSYHNIVDGIPTGKERPGWYPCEDFPQWLNMIKKVVRRHKEDADIVFWTYNWGWQPEEARLKLIEALPTDISLQATFEMFEKFDLGGSTEYCADYTLAFEGYGSYFKSEAEAAHKRGIRLYSMTNTGGLTWDLGVVPYQPFPYQWIKRYRAMQEAHDKWGLCGLMECHHYGFYPSFISKLSKWAFCEPCENIEEVLFRILQSEYGMEAAQQVDQALKLWSEASTFFVPTTADQYGAFRVGPSYPFCLDAVTNLVATPYNVHGNSICLPTYAQYHNGLAGLHSVRIHAEMESLEQMKKLMEEGIAILEEIEYKNEKLQYLLNLGWFIYRTVITGIHAKRWHYLKSLLRCERDKVKLEDILDKMEALLHAERKNAEDCIPLVQYDSRLGWEPYMEYMTDEEHLKWKLRQVDYVLNSEMVKTRNALRLS